MTLEMSYQEKFEQGLEQGIEQGFNNAKIELALKMLENKKLSIEEIALYSQLPIEQITALEKKIQQE